MLYVIATPIGNLGDISFRAIEILKSAALLIAENPHHSKVLLDHYSLGRKELVQFAEHNEQDVAEKLAGRLRSEDGCLVTDAGTPGLSDPGFRLVRACIAAGVPVVPIPGANAAVAALSASGLPTDRFLFVGFLPKTEPKVLKILEQAKAVESTLIFYESPQRIEKTIVVIAKHYPEVHVVLARELTKLHEDFIRGTAASVLQELQNRPSIKGEFTGLVSFKKF